MDVSVQPVQRVPIMKKNVKYVKLGLDSRHNPTLNCAHINDNVTDASN